jgi:CHAT domain-containing protein
VADEIAEVSEWLRRRGFDACVMGGEATRTEVSRRLETAAVCHLACHGIFEPDSPDRSGVILGGAEEDRVLSVRVLAGLDLRGLRQIVLSSCWSADSFVLPGRWVISLPKILLYAGAGSVIGSLWEVDDRLAQGFMGRFYRRLETMRRDEALRLTQLDCIHGEVKEADAADPIYWAGYALYGDSGRLTQPNKTR